MRAASAAAASSSASPSRPSTTPSPAECPSPPPLHRPDLVRTTMPASSLSISSRMMEDREAPRRRRPTRSDHASPPHFLSQIYFLCFSRAARTTRPGPVVSVSSRMREDQQVSCRQRPTQSDQPCLLAPRLDLAGHHLCWLLHNDLYGPESCSIHRGHSGTTMFLICSNAAQGILSSCSFRYAATNLFKMLLKYRPDDKAARKESLLKRAQAESEGKTVEVKKPIAVKCGPNHVAYLIEQNKA